ncbi:O-antigen ligase family protein [Parathalassolituus penaei]|uniref:O-antigen ligase family protein n=1 Tax=Parathalassolituus penaei TaxID=2997323 RepID=A0A9X3EHP7_9GAMM|nr:O-antigen ligase family protein [Parathalassolituus penaei]MCY0966934.1 O-antigen ligase family protein [Parathalassolituus penaei]
MSQWRNFQIVTFLLPLPFGANVDWAWPVFVAAILMMLGLELRFRCQQAEERFLTAPVWPEPLRRSRWLIWALFLVQAWVAVQWLVISNTPYDTLSGLLKGLGYSAWFVLALLMLDQRSHLERIIWIVSIAAAFQAFYGAMMVMTGAEMVLYLDKAAVRSHVGSAVGTFISRNNLAGYLELALALGIGSLLAQSARYEGSWRARIRQFTAVLLSPKIILRLLLAVMVIGLVMSRSRMGNSAFFASMSITGVLALVLMRHKTTATTVLLGSLLVIDIFIVGAFFGIDKVAERIEQTSAESEQRDEMTLDAYNMWLSAPITGIGAGGTMANSSQFKKATTFPLWVDHPHNDFIEFLSEYGAPAFLALLGVVLTALWNSLVAMRTRRSDFYRGMGFAACMGIIAYGIHSTVDFNLQIPSNALLFMMILAIAQIARYAPHESSSEVGDSSSRRSSGRSRRSSGHSRSSHAG